MNTMEVHYMNVRTSLCDLGAKYDTDKSPWRQNVNDGRHAHPYTCLYDTLFREFRDKQDLTICELGILQGSSLDVWSEYFPQAKVFGFDYDTSLIQCYDDRKTSSQVQVGFCDIHDATSIQNACKSIQTSVGEKECIDILIEDTTHIFQDQIRAVKECWPYIKPGGILIVEDIFLSAKESDYVQALGPILSSCASWSFIKLDHTKKYSKGWDNDKVLVLRKVIPKLHPITIITPCSRPQNLKHCFQSLNPSYVTRWIIVYDAKKVNESNRQFSSESWIEEYFHTSDGISGNPQRNFALDLLQQSDYKGFVYFLDDDNIVHPLFYNLIQYFQPGYFYTWDSGTLRGDTCAIASIDTAMFCVDFSLVSNQKWSLHEYAADGMYIASLHANHQDKHVYFPMKAAYYNQLP